MDSSDFCFNPEHLGEDVQTLFANSTAATIIAPFITKAGFLPLVDALAPGGRIDVVTRWDPLEIVAGVSDPMIIDNVIATGGTLRLLPRLHAKVYLTDTKALVGSANPTGPGLGFTNPANIEIVVPTEVNNPALVRLIEVVEAVASIADRDYAVQLVNYAESLPKSAAGAAPDIASGAAYWIPTTMVPSRVLELYLGGMERYDYRADLDVICAPPELTADAFRAYVGLILQQGLIGRIFRECEGMLQWHGVEHMRRLLINAGIEISDEPMMLWNRLLNWFKYYLGATDSPAGGYIAKR